MSELEKIKKEVWKQIEKEWHEAGEKFNKEHIVADFPFDEPEEVVQLAIKRACCRTAERIFSKLEEESLSDVDLLNVPLNIYQGIKKEFLGDGK